VCDFDELIMRVVKDGTVGESTIPPEPYVAPEKEPLPELLNTTPVQTARLKYSKAGMASYLGHLDVQNSFMRAISLAGLPVVFSQGFNSRPKISSGPALPLGYTSDAEYMDILLFHQVDSIIEDLNKYLPGGVAVLEVEWHKGRIESVTSQIAAIKQQIVLEDFPAEMSLEKLKQNFEQKNNVYIKRERKQRVISLDIKVYIQSIEIKGNSLEVVTLVQNGKGIRLNEFLPAFFEVPIESLPIHTVKREAVFMNFTA
jgi:radical SAM-linked protein